jgi:hypothetical protein
VPAEREKGYQQMGGNTDETLEVLRTVWSAQAQTAEDIEEACGNTKSCRRMSDVGFDGLAEETDGDLRVAWRTQLAREGKLNPGAGSVRDLVLPPAETR